MSEEQVLPEFIATLKAAAEKAGYQRWEHKDGVIVGEDGHNLFVGHWATLLEGNFIGLASPENILKLLASLAQSEAERERLRGELAEMTKDRNLWQESHDDDCPNKAMVGTLRAELARERELHQGLRGRIKSAVEKLEDWNGDARGFSGSAAVTDAIALLEDKSKPVATT